MNRANLHPHLLAVLSAVATSCSSTGPHFAGDTWRSGFDQMSRDPYQWVPAAAAVAATPLALMTDRTTSAESVEDRIFNSNTRYGDELALGIGFAPVLLGGAVGLTTGDTRYLEVAAEATVFTAAETQFLKFAVNRRRPNGSGNDSFPSGHSSFTFCGATLLARWWAQEHDGSPLGYLLYLPASYVGITRLEGERHYLSDIAFGAALGMLTANLIWNAHFGDAEHPGLFGRGIDAQFAPVVSEDGVGLGLSLSF